MADEFDLVAPVQPIDWPPTAPPWFAAWMKADDRRRAETMAAGKARRGGTLTVETTRGRAVGAERVRCA